MGKVYFSVALILLLCSCGKPSSDNGFSVFVSIAPQKHFVERIAGDLVAVTVMVPTGSDPHTYEPRPAQMAALHNASIYFSIGVPFEDHWLERIVATNPDILVVDTARGIRRVVRDHCHDHSHLHEHQHDHHGAPDPHIWLSPSLVRIQAENISLALQEMDPANAETYRHNLGLFIAEIEALSRYIGETLEEMPSRKIMVFHPSWGYFADDFQLEMISVEQGGQEPGPADLAGFIALAEEEDIRVVFAQPEFSTDAAEVIAREIGGTVVLLSPLAEEWTANMRTIAETLAGVSGE